MKTQTDILKHKENIYKGIIKFYENPNWYTETQRKHIRHNKIGEWCNTGIFLGNKEEWKESFFRP